MKKERGIIRFPKLKAHKVIILFMLIIPMSFWGCAGKEPVPVANPLEEITLSIESDADANDGQPLGMMIREVNSKRFLTDGYDEIAGMAHTDPRDENLLEWCMLLPGKNEEIKIVKPSKSDIGIYCLFTQPGENWRLMLKSPLGDRYKIMVRKNSLEYEREE